jgi:lipopolysaccharide/colanic/teichoic acid biosynthesis glycosyltransferase
MLAESVARADEPVRLLDTSTPSSRPPCDLLVPTRYLFWKRGFEVLLALTLGVVSGPLILLCVLAVKLTSRGPVFYSQIRVGRKGLPFRIWKIRTMVSDAEAAGARWCVPGDPRVTLVGRFLRKTHLDELPQLWNVLRGDMSLVGPRPERPEFVPQLEKEIPRYRDRLLVRPGLTGLAQVQLPPDTDLESVRRKLACDLYYVQHISFWLDLRLIIATSFYLLNLSTTWPCRVLRIPGGEPVQQAYQQLIASREGPKDAS